MMFGSKERGATSSSSAATRSMENNGKKKSIAQYNADAKLLADFEQSAESGKSFNYSKSVIDASVSVPEEQIVAYLSRIQRGGLIQPFGCMIAVEEPTFKIISYSENCVDLLGLNAQFETRQLLSLIGIDARILFNPSSAVLLTKTIVSSDLSLLNPIWVHSRMTQKPFYAILHRIDVGTVIDLEPSLASDPALSLAGAVQSQKLAVRAISRLQALPGGDIGMLCDTIVDDVQKLTGYDRVMVYKFHEDDHGEVLSEIRRSDLEPYLGLHYPSIDIPQAARFLFKQNRVRMICDCNANPVRVIQSEELRQPLCLVNSTLRAPHGCHTQYMANMGTISSLAMAVTINSNDGATKLWGLVVCHHTSARYVPFPLRYACEFLMQAFALQLYIELQLSAQLAEKKILKTQTLLCDMLLRDSPSGIVTQSPNIMDLVKCDGAGLYYRETCWLVGITPPEALVKDISEWILNNHEDSTGLSTDSLADAGYPGAALLGDAVCGMAIARITSKDFLFWFRSHTAKEIKWGGAKHHPEDKDDIRRLHPRSSFITFLEVVKNKSMPWEVSEINAIHSLQLIMRDSLRELDDNGFKSMSVDRQNNNDMDGFNELSSVACEMVRLIETAKAPIFGVDTNGLINGWNAKVAELTGLKSSEAMGKSLINEIVHEDSHRVVQHLLFRALQGEEDKDVELKLKSFQKCDVYIVANACTSRDCSNNVVGVCFVGQDVTSEKIVMDKFICLQGDYKAIIQSVNPLIPPIFSSDSNLCCYEWNTAMKKLTGWSKDEIIGKMLPGEIFGRFCPLKDANSLTKFRILLYKGISGQRTEKFSFEFYDRNERLVEALLTSSERTDAKGHVVGCFCFLQVSSPELIVQIEQENKNKNNDYLSRVKETAYIRQEIRNPLNGIRFTHQLLENTSISDDQKQLLVTSAACERQMLTIIDDLDLRSIEEGNFQLNVEEFVLGSVLDAIVCQAMILLKEKNIQLIHEISEEVKMLSLYGDQIRLQLVLSDFFLNVVHHAPCPDGWVEIKISSGPNQIQDENELINLQCRMTHPGEGVPSAIIQYMFEGENGSGTQEGLGLNLSRKLLLQMNGKVNYVREHEKCYFLIDLQLKTNKTNRPPPPQHISEKGS